MSTKKMLSETLDDLSSEELEEFKSLIELEKGFPLFSRGQLKVTNTQNIVELMVETYSQECVELTKKVLKKMNRTDLVQRFSDISSGTKEKHSVDEQRPSLIQRVETMTSVIELLLETFKDLSDVELEKFKEVLLSQSHLHRHRLDFKSMELKSTDIQDRVFSVVQTYGQQSMKRAMEFLKMMNRTDLVQRLSDSSSGPKKKHPVDEHVSALIHKVATMAAVKELLLETLSDLNHEELKSFKWFLQFTSFQRSLPQMSWTRLKWANLAEILVDVMMEKCGQQSVEVTREVFMYMNRNDLVQRLSETSSGPKEKHSVDDHWPALIQNVETMASVIELLLETMKDLSGQVLKFKDVLLYKTDLHIRFSDTPWMLQNTTDMQDTVFLMVQTYVQQSLQKTKEVLKEMKRTDLVQRLSDSSSGPKKKHSADARRSALIQRVATIAAVKQLLLETLNDLRNEELKKFKMFLQVIFYQNDLPDISWMLSYPGGRADTVDLMVQTFGQQSVELTRDAFTYMNRSDLVQRLSKPSSGLKEKHSVDQHRRALFERAAAVEVVKLILLETLNDLSHWELETFKRFLQFTCFQRSLPQISWRQLQRGDRLVDLMVQSCGQQSVEVTKEVLRDMNRTDLVQKLSEASSKPKGPPISFELEGCGSIMQDSSDWTKLEPEVNSTNADEAPTYSLQSERGDFECSISGLRWVSKEKVSFKYQFCSWEEPMERMGNIQYMPAGPLMDITVTAGKLDEVYLPHWICIDDKSTLSDKFAVLHVDDCGDVVEKVSEVTPSHVKLSEPIFSLKAALIKAGISLKINCNVLIYKTNTAFLTLHVYLIPRDPALQQMLDKRELSYGYNVIRKPPPEKSLKMNDRFILTADLDGAEIYPEKLKLRHESTPSLFFEVYFENPDTNFKLKLTQENEPQPVWTCAIRKDEYQSTAHIQGEHFVDKHQCDLIKRVSNIGPILDDLLREGVIQQEGYDTICAIPTTQEQMRKLYSGSLKAGGLAAKDIFYKILEKEESYLVADLKRKES